MAKLSFLLCLITALFILLSYANEVKIGDIFTVHDGRMDHGGCGRREKDILDNWLTENSYSLATALEAVRMYRQDVRVRRAMSTIFGIQNSGPGYRERSATGNAIREVEENLEWALRFFNHDTGDHGYLFDSERHWLFCHSTFLTLHEPTFPASDFEGKDILDENRNRVLIRDVPRYQMELAKDPDIKPWWSGDFTVVKGYYFAEYGGNYCYEDELGLTAGIVPLKADGSDNAEEGDFISSVILCPHSFDGSPRPASYRDANNLLDRGRNLADAVPRSTTLLHEIFHVIFGNSFLSGDDERYDIASCLNLANRDPAAARKNPENYVYFVAHMYHLFGEDEGNHPWSIQRNWDFTLIGSGRSRVYGAF